MNRQLGYCTNVHAGAGLAETRANLEHYALAVKQRVSPSAPMGVGLWLSAAAVRQLAAEGEVELLRDWLADVGLVPFTLNGFPFGDFHQPAVKHRVYEPNWFDQRRLDYTFDLAALLDRLLPDSMEGSISTLPIAWRKPAPSTAQLSAAANRLRQSAQYLAQLERQTGRLIYLCLEPEPGCVLEHSGDVVRFYETHLLPGADERTVLRYIRVCHDACHAAVMFEDQEEAMERYRSAGVEVGKVQVSSAVCAPLDRLAEDQRAAALQQLASFAEDRYLHQTLVRKEANAELQFYDDLPAALEHHRGRETHAGQWRVHFHVPIYLERFGLLETSQPQIKDCLQTAIRSPGLIHFEVETYAWSVLPNGLQQPDLAAGVARELHWLAEAFQSLGVDRDP